MDELGDGLLAGGLTLTTDGEIQFQIRPGDVTLRSPGATGTYWSYSVDSCTMT